MTDDNTLILNTYHGSLRGQYESYDITIKIHKNIDQRFIFNLSGHAGDRPCEVEETFDSWNECFDKFLNECSIMGTGFATYEIIYLEKSYRYFYTEKLINHLNKFKYSEIPTECKKSFNIKLRIKLKCVKNANKKGLKEIVIQGKNLGNKNYFVGNIEDCTTQFLIKNKENEVIKTYFSHSYFVYEINEIYQKYFWYFEKVNEFDY